MTESESEQPADVGGCCSPAPGGSCCGAPAKEAVSPAPQRSNPCCAAPPAVPADHPYGPAAYVSGAIDTAAGPVPRVSRRLSRDDVMGTWRVRWGRGRGDYRVKPGLYALGEPDAAAPVLVTANYKLTFDQLRSSLGELDAWLLVVDTHGINVWCAAGKGTFSAAEVALRVHEAELAQIVDHRRLILPQLSAPGVAAHEVKKACGFRATFGPVRAADVPAFLAAGMKADTEMRTVTFDTKERAVLAPVELSIAWDRRMLLAYGVILATSAIDRDGFSIARGVRRGVPVVGATWLALLAGGAVTPVLLPWLPGRAFSLKGAVAGATLAAGATAAFRRRLSPAAKLALLSGVPAAASFAAMNFTGATPITSPSGVELEMRRSLPAQAAGAVVAISAWLASRMGR